MAKKISVLLLAMCWCGASFADEVLEPPEIELDAPPPKEAKYQPAKTKTITVYDSKVFPGFRPCTTEDYRNQDHDPVACQDDEVARILSTREEDLQPRHSIIGDDMVPPANIYKLRFERFRKKKIEQQ